MPRKFGFLDADRPEDEFRVFCPRRAGHQYEVDDDGAGFVICTIGSAGFPSMRGAAIRLQSG